MDRFEQWALFAAVAQRRSFVAAARALGRSPQSVTRAIAALEARIGSRLFARTTRAVALTGDGERYLAQARRVLAEVDALERPQDATTLRGTLAITAPVLFGERKVVPLVTELLAQHPALDVRLLLVDRVVSLADEGIDIAVRIGALPDSSLRARLVGHVRQVVCASPRYLARAGTPRTPAQLAKHACIAFSGTTPIVDRWSFAGERPIAIHPRLVTNTAGAAIAAALAGAGITRVVSYQVDELLAAGKLVALLERHAPSPLPVHVLQLPGLQHRAALTFIELAQRRLPTPAT